MKITKAISDSLVALGKFWQDKFNSQIFRYNLILIAVQFSLLIVKFNQLPPQVPLYYSLPYNESQLASATSLFLLPIFSLSVLLINHFFSALLLRSYLLISRLSLITSICFSFLSLVTLFQIINLIS